MKSRHLSSPFLSVVTPVLNEAAFIETLVTQLHQTLLSLTPYFEIVIVDDGSRDGTAGEVKRLQEKYPQELKFVRFSRNFGKENALTAGLRYTSGDAVILVDADLQKPLDMLPHFLEKWREGYDNVYGCRIRSSHDQGFIARFFGENFYKISRYLMEIDLPANASDFRLLDRKVVDAILTLPERTRFMKGLYAWVGFKSIGLPYREAPRSIGKSRFNFLKLCGLALTGITAFSNFPLRVWSWLGGVISGLSLFYGLFLGVRTLIYGNAVSGWATLSVAIFFLGGIQLISIGVLAEYIARIFSEVKQRPLYVVEEESGFDDINQK